MPTSNHVIEAPLRMRKTSAPPSVPGLIAADTTEALFGQLAESLAGLGISRFSAFAVRGEDAALIFSRGAASSRESSAGESLKLDKSSALTAFLADDTLPLWVPPSPAVTPSDATSALDLLLADASVVVRLAGSSEQLGFLVVHGLVPESIFSSPHLDDLQVLLTMFSSLFLRMDRAEHLRRDHARAQARIDSFRNIQDILLLATVDEVVDITLRRILHALGSHTGSVWLIVDGRFQVGQLIGMPTTEQMENTNRLIETSLARGQPVAINAMSNEDVLSFDVDTLHLVSAVTLPMVTPNEPVGCVVVFDTTVSGETLEVLGEITRVAAIAVENARRRAQMLDEQRMREQLALGAKMQQRLLPTKRLVSPDFSVAHYSRYCDETGGDYVDTVQHKGSRVVSFVIGDVSGHGLAAALVMVDVRARLRTLMDNHGGAALQQMMAYLNTCLCHETADDEFATLVLSTLDLNTGLLTYVSAGHEAPLRFRPTTGEWIELPSTGLPLGMIENADYEVGHAWLEVGDVLLFLTDGVTEAVDRQGQAFGNSSIKRIVAAAAPHDAQSILDAVLQHTMNQCDSRCFVDDVTYLLVKAEHVTLKQCAELLPAPGESVYSASFASTREEKDHQLVAAMNVLSGRFAGVDLGGVFMAIEEALTNAVVHGNHELPSLMIDFQIVATPKNLVVTVSDQGPGFSPRSSVEGASDPDRLLMESGRGLTMMVTMMDEVIYGNGGRSVRLIKNLETR